MREQLRARLAEVWPELEIVGEARNGIEAVEMAAQHRPDVIFLDIRMPGLDGVGCGAPDRAAADARRGAGDGWPGCEIVFITAYDQYAIEAFEQGAVDYVLKPAERERLHVTRGSVAPAHRSSAAREIATAAPLPMQASGDAAVAADSSRRSSHRLPPQRLHWIQASVGQTIQMIAVDDVLFFISDEKYTRVQTATVEALIRKPIKELVDELDPAQFWQIHRSTLVNVRADRRRQSRHARPPDRDASRDTRRSSRSAGATRRSSRACERIGVPRPAQPTW